MSRHLLSRHSSRCCSVQRSTSRGFTLLEVLIAVVVTAIGLLGVAKMQSLAFASTGTANVRSLIAIEAASLSSLMRANRTYWAATGPSAWAGANPRAIVITNSNGAVRIDDATLNNTASTATFANNLCAPGSGLSCTDVTALAANDLHIWEAGLINLLPYLNITTTISCPNFTPINCTITMSWVEKTVAINAQGAAATNTAISAPQYVLYVEP